MDVLIGYAFSKDLYIIIAHFRMFIHIETDACLISRGIYRTSTGSNAAIKNAML